MKLSIAVVTMNRAEQLLEALYSCVVCDLPNDTEFIIIDNASTDNTRDVIKVFFEDHKYNYYYEKLKENIGCGNGRNYAYQMSHGDYVYFLDDDAYIDTSKNNRFFEEAIKVLDSNNDIATLTTQIYDMLFKDYRVSVEGPQIQENLYSCMRFCGGSHFLRRDFFGDSRPYYPNKYGLEEIFPSLRVIDAGLKNGLITDIQIIHNPKVNKWESGSVISKRITENEIICKLGMKLSIYPRIVHPILYLASFARICKNLSLSKFLLIPFDKRVTAIKEENKGVKRIQFSTILKMYKLFGFSVF